jgi:hypothetical protein
VLVITYGCVARADGDPVLTDEHKEVGLFTEREAAGLPMPEGYKRSITAWYAMLNTPTN